MDDLVNLMTKVPNSVRLTVFQCGLHLSTTAALSSTIVGEGGTVVEAKERFYHIAALLAPGEKTDDKDPNAVSTKVGLRMPALSESNFESHQS